MILKNRQIAGQILATRLLKYKDTDDVLVLALPRGGAPVAAEIAFALKAPLDVLIVRKVCAPFQAELAVVAICEKDEPLWNQKLLASTGLEPDDLHSVVRSELNKIKSQTNCNFEPRWV